jgi:hypothetical protein
MDDTTHAPKDLDAAPMVGRKDCAGIVCVVLGPQR